MQSAELDDDTRHGALALIQLRLDDRALCGTVGIGFEFQHFRLQIDRVEKVVDAHARLCGYGDDHRIAAPFFGDEILFDEPLFHAVGVHFVFIHFIHGDDDGYTRPLWRD